MEIFSLPRFSFYFFFPGSFFLAEKEVKEIFLGICIMFSLTLENQKERKKEMRLSLSKTFPTGRSREEMEKVVI